MAEGLEVLLWCAALATWLMLLFAFTGEGLKRLPKSIHRLVKEAFKINTK